MAGLQNQRLDALELGMNAALAEINRLTAENARLNGLVGLPPVARVPELKAIVTKYIAEDASIVLDPEQQTLPLTLDVRPRLELYLMKAKLQSATLTLNQFVDCVLIWLDPESAMKLRDSILLYDPLEETNINPDLDSDWRERDLYLIPLVANVDLMFPRFLRFLVKKLFSSKLQNVVKNLFLKYQSSVGLQTLSPSAMIKKLEEFRGMSRGEREDLLIPRSAVYLAFKDMMSRASSRHAQTLSLVISTIEAHYTDVETVAGIVNVRAEQDHKIKLVRIAKACDVQYGVQPALTAGIHNTHVGVNQVRGFEDQASEASERSAGFQLSNLSNGGLLTFSIEEPVVRNIVLTEQEQASFEEELSKEDLRVLADCFPGSTLGCIHALVVRNGKQVGSSGFGTRGQRESRTCFYCKKPGHIQADCNKRAADRTGRTNSFIPQEQSQTPSSGGRPFSSLFSREKVGGFNKGGAYKLRAPNNNRYRILAKSRNNSRIHYLQSEEDVQQLPADAELYVVEIHEVQVSSENSWSFDLA